MSYLVTAPLVISKKPDGSDLYLYENAVVPEFVTDDEVKRLVAAGLVEDSAGSKRSGKKPTESN